MVEVLFDHGLDNRGHIGEIHDHICLWTFRNEFFGAYPQDKLIGVTVGFAAFAVVE